MVKVGILGATGYAGAELVRLLSKHPEVELAVLTSQTYAGQPMSDVYPGLAGYADMTLSTQDIEKIVKKVDVVFIALPHGHATLPATEALNSGKVVIDLGADFRLREGATYAQWYGGEHPAPDLLGQAVYGLTEVYRRKITGSSLIANPGCYPTGAILALAPALAAGLVDPVGTVIDSKSGVSGAGRELKLGSLFVECNENVHAYGVATHRHTPEIEQELSGLAGGQVTISFTPHLVPMNRGILTTVYVSVRAGTDETRVRQAYEDYFGGENFIRLLPAGRWPQTRWVRGSNYCDIGLVMDRRVNRLIVVSAIDNLVKGAAGQAVQNMNLIFGLPEVEGLNYPGLLPA